MKIVHVTNYFSMRYRYQEYYMLREHVRAGHEVIVLTSDRNFPFPDYENTAQKVFGDRIIGTGVQIEDQVKIIRLPVLFEARGRVWLRGLNRVIREIKPDVIISHSILDLNTMLLAVGPMPGRFIIDEHQVATQHDRGLMGKLVCALFRRFMTPILLRKAEKFIAISDNCITVMHDSFGIPHERIEVIPLGADPDVFKFDHELRLQFRAEHHINETDLVIIHTGKFYDEKKSHVIVDAANAVITDKKIHLLFVGACTSEYTSIFNDALKRSVHPFTFIPMVGQAELVAAFSASDIAVWPAGPTISTLEAASCRLPVICHNALTERLRMDNGIGIKFGDVEELTAALQLLINDDARRSAMGENGQRFIRSELSWQVLTERFIR